LEKLGLQGLKAYFFFFGMYSITTH
jgi:hypothetical protein